MNYQLTTTFRRDELIYNNDVDMIGSGGFGIVYRCQLRNSQSNSSEIVALKVLATPYKLRQKELGAFMQEASILKSLVDCPHIVRFLGLCIDPGHYAIVMEYVEYGNLQDMLLSGVDEHPVIKQWNCRIRMAADIAKGMNYLHSRVKPIIHGDLKTANVLVDHNYCCKIIDFGLAKVREISEQTPRDQPRAGTVSFTAPEVFEAKVEKGKEKKVDVYSYAIVLWQLKELKCVNAGVNHAVIRANVVVGVRPPLSNDDECLEEYRDLIVRCWNAEPDVRLHFKEIVTMCVGMIKQYESLHEVEQRKEVCEVYRNIIETYLEGPNGYDASCDKLLNVKIGLSAIETAHGSGSDDLEHDLNISAAKLLEQATDSLKDRLCSGTYPAN
ncbi:probable serine/threonine-protein kinase drkD isoform X1 [Corticium candelabrum]|uniref:probable serine/threonine-protein kinase drkD isoform X1 n=1 Tax=Corticium candelabrum TaxID=121492 RepID=UPI002E252D50|nr:probable serine/threonine-protein kinase drkD isoform X1 [Corticium candelabrum]XP_062500997.1 probable serine/threonine-protein kinase drkD isoform X1 [Corticium candelabrum]